MYGMDDVYGLISNGTFTSPNYPHEYENDISCLLYQFIGATNEVVEVEFDAFQLESRQTGGK